MQNWDKGSRATWMTNLLMHAGNGKISNLAKNQADSSEHSTRVIVPCASQWECGSFGSSKMEV